MELYCEKSSLQFDKKAVYYLHLSIAHEEKVEIKLEQTFDILEKEMEEPEKIPFQCSYCDKAFSDQNNLKKHVLTTHKKKIPFKCDICDYCCSEKG